MRGGGTSYGRGRPSVATIDGSWGDQLRHHKWSTTPTPTHLWTTSGADHLQCDRLHCPYQIEMVAR